MNEHAKPPFPKQQQPMPGRTARMRPRPDHGEESYVGAGRLKDKKAIITGGGQRHRPRRRVAYAREGADVLIVLPRRARRRATRPSAWSRTRAAKRYWWPATSRTRRIAAQSIEQAVTELGGIDILVNNAAHQASFTSSSTTFPTRNGSGPSSVNIHAMFYLTKAAVPHMKPGSAIINTASINADTPNPTLLRLRDHQGSDPEFHRRSGAAARREGNPRQRRRARADLDAAHSVDACPRRRWRNSASNVPMKRPGQPAELATAYVMLADPLSSYVSGATDRGDGRQTNPLKHPV